jgi:hypothetical protein
VVELRSRTPCADLDVFDHDRRLAAVPDLFTVDRVTRYVAWTLSRPPPASLVGEPAKMAGA